HPPVAGGQRQRVVVPQARKWCAHGVSRSSGFGVAGHGCSTMVTATVQVRGVAGCAVQPAGLYQPGVPPYGAQYTSASASTRSRASSRCVPTTGMVRLTSCPGLVVATVGNPPV